MNDLTIRNSAGDLEQLASELLSVRAATRLEGNPPAMSTDAAPPSVVCKGVSPYVAAATNTVGGDVQVEGGDFGGVARLGNRPGTFAEVAGVPKRIQLVKQFGAQGLVQANASFAAGVDPDFEILGTNASDADVTFNAEGGLTIETDGANADQEVFAPHLAGQSPWTGFTWGTDRETHWGCYLETGAAITAEKIFAGLIVTGFSSPFVVGTAADQVIFYYDVATGANWRCYTSIAGVDTDTDTGVVVAVSTMYQFDIEIDADRVARFFIDGVPVDTSGALTAADLIPYIGIQADAAAAKSMTVHAAHAGRDRLAA